MAELQSLNPPRLCLSACPSFLEPNNLAGTQLSGLKGCWRSSCRLLAVSLHTGGSGGKPGVSSLQGLECRENPGTLTLCEGKGLADAAQRVAKLALDTPAHAQATF